MNWEELTAHELVQHRRRSVIFMMVGVPFMTFAFFAAEPTRPRLMRIAASIFLVGAYLVGVGLHGLVKATLAIHRRGGVVPESWDELDEGELRRIRVASVMHLALGGVVFAIGYFDERAPVLRYASFVLAAAIVGASLVRIARSTLQLRKRKL